MPKVECLIFKVEGDGAIKAVSGLVSSFLGGQPKTVEVPPMPAALPAPAEPPPAPKALTAAARPKAQAEPDQLRPAEHGGLQKAILFLLRGNGPQTEGEIRDYVAARGFHRYSSTPALKSLSEKGEIEWIEKDGAWRAARPA